MFSIYLNNQPNLDVPHLIPFYLPKSTCALALSFSNSEIQHFNTLTERVRCFFFSVFALCFYSPNTICNNLPKHGHQYPFLLVKPGLLYGLNDIFFKSAQNIAALDQSNNNPRDGAEQLERRTRGTELHFTRKTQI